MAACMGVGTVCMAHGVTWSCCLQHRHGVCRLKCYLVIVSQLVLHFDVCIADGPLCAIQAQHCQEVPADACGLNGTCHRRYQSNHQQRRVLAQQAGHCIHST